MKRRTRLVCLLGSVLACLAGCGVLTAVSVHMAGSLPHQQAAERFAGSGGELPYAQVSVFTNEENRLTEGIIGMYEESMNDALREASLEASSEEARLWYDAWSAQAGSMELSGTRGGSVTASVTAVGGDFFAVHPVRLVAGGYFSQEDLMQDRILIDTTLAWQLFGSWEVEGMTVTVMGHPCIVSGVTEPDPDSASKAAYGEAPRCYLSFTLYEAMQQEQGMEARADCYEAVLPNPVHGFARGKLTNVIGEAHDGMVIVQNTGRYGIAQRYHTLCHLRALMTASDGVTYPHWENAARIRDYDEALLLLWQCVLLVWPCLFGLMMLWKGYRALGRFLAQRHRARKRRYRTIPEQP